MTPSQKERGHFISQFCRFHLGPLSEGAVAAQAVTGGVSRRWKGHSLRLLLRKIHLPQRGRQGARPTHFLVVIPRERNDPGNLKCIPQIAAGVCEVRRLHECRGAADTKKALFKNNLYFRVLTFLALSVIVCLALRGTEC